MSTPSIPSIDSETMASLKDAVETASKGVRDPVEMQKACERMDRMREENRRLFGEQDIGVSIIREMRGELPDA
jgi:hypothetical protein